MLRKYKKHPYRVFPFLLELAGSFDVGKVHCRGAYKQACRHLPSSIRTQFAIMFANAGSFHCKILQNQKRFFRFFLFGLELTRFNHGKGVYIIKTKFCISPRRKPCISSLRKKIQPTADDIHLR